MFIALDQAVILETSMEWRGDIQGGTSNSRAGGRGKQKERELFSLERSQASLTRPSSNSNMK